MFFSHQEQNKIDLGIAWEWEYDRDFIISLEDACHQRGCTTYLIYPGNLEESLPKLRRGELKFQVFLDRASDTKPEFATLVNEVKESGTRMLNDGQQMLWAMDKATMHLEFLNAGIDVPYTIILSSHEDEPELKISALARLGRPFIIKPAIGGGGTGVVLGAETLQDVIQARMARGSEKFILQEKVVPVSLAERRAWFRVFYVLEEIFPCWWGDLTHIYQPVTAIEEENLGLYVLRDITNRIAGVVKLDFFSTEIAMTTEDKFIVVDYVNEVCDMRLQSKYHDGVCDSVVEQIVNCMADFVANYVGERRD